MHKYFKGMVSMGITTKDIAKIAGVSQSTVSRCLNDSKLISEETKNRIKEIAAQYGFEFNANARSLSTNKTGTIGVIYPENFNDFSNNLYLSSLHNQLRDSLEKENLDLIVSFANNRYTGQSNIRRMVLRKKVDGLIIVRNDIDNETLMFLNKSKIPFIFMHHFIDDPDLSNIDIIASDHEYGGYLAGRYLAGLGHRNIACIAVKGIGTEYDERTSGFKAALKDSKLTFDDRFLFYGDSTFKSGYSAVRENIDAIKGITAMFVHNDIMALGAIEALKEYGLKVPDDVSIIGYDDIELCTYFKPYLTTIHQQREEIARLACERLVELLKAKRPKTKKIVRLKPNLVIRDSCRPLA